MRKSVYSASQTTTLEDVYRKLQKLSYALDNLPADEQDEFEKITGISTESVDDAYRYLHGELHQQEVL